MSRRSLLQAGVLGTVGLTLPDFLQLAEGAAPTSSYADSVLFVNLAGGPSHLDTLDMKENLTEGTRSEFAPIQSKIPGLVVCEHLPKLAQIIDQFTLIRGISHTTGDHPQGQAYVSTGNRPSPALRYPSYGSIISNELPGDPDLPPYVAVPQTEWSAGFMGDAFGPFKTNAVPQPGKPFTVRGLSPSSGVTIDKIKRRHQLLTDLNTRLRESKTNNQLLEALDTFESQAYHMITSAQTQLAFDVSREPESIQKLFTADELSQSLLLSVRLIESGVRFVTVTNQGWDTHLDNFTGHKKLLSPLDHGLTAMIAALRSKGLLERTLVCIMGEFGRTPKINQNAGRDHYPRANWCLMTGGGIQPGQLIGATDNNGAGPDDDTDIHPDDLGASMLHALGINHHKEYYTRTGRPVSLIANGRVIRELFR